MERGRGIDKLSAGLGCVYYAGRKKNRSGIRIARRELKDRLKKNQGRGNDTDLIKN